MKSKRLLHLQVWTVVLLVAYVLFSSYLFFLIPRTGMPMRLSDSVSKREVQTDDLSQLQSDFSFAASYAREIQLDRSESLMICLVASIGVVSFLTWNIFVISRVKREIDPAA
jgi:hypothetical protein